MPKKINVDLIQNALDNNKIPIIKRENQNIAIGVKLGGMGIAIGSLIGKKVADLLIE